MADAIQVSVNGLYVGLSYGLILFGILLVYHGDVAPSFYPVLSSFPAWVVPCWAGEATGAGAEPLA